MIKIADEESELLNLKAPEPAKMPDVRDVTSYEMYHSVNELSTPIPELVAYNPNALYPAQISQLPGLMFLEAGTFGIVAGQVNSSGYYILRYFGLSGISLCKFADMASTTRHFYDNQEDLLKLWKKNLNKEELEQYMDKAKAWLEKFKV